MSRGLGDVYKRQIVNILSGRTYEEAADMLGISIEDVKEAEAAIKAIDK